MKGCEMMGFKEQRLEIMSICRELIENKKVELILGFTSGENGETAIPFFIRDVSDIEKIRWDETCTPNLAKYLTEKARAGKIAIIAKPCDARAIVMYMVEKQIDRDSLYIIGVECAGMKGKDGNAAPGCGECGERVPPVYDVLVEHGELPSFSKTKADVKNKEEDKFARFKKEIDKCILCFSCRQACYGCYCSTCFIDRGMPDWSPSDPDSGRKMMFHLGRAMHLAGRCVGCGACEKVCPSGVKIRYLVQKLECFCEELYGTKPGINPDEAPAVTVFDQSDKEVGFLG